MVNRPVTEADKNARIAALHNISKTMATPGWAALMELWKWKRIEIELKGKKAKKEDSSLGYWKMLDGFDMAVNLATDAIYQQEREEEMAAAIESSQFPVEMMGE